MNDNFEEISNIIGDGTEEYYLKGFHLAKIRDQLGGVNAFDSCMFNNSVNGLIRIGWDVEKIKQAIAKEFNFKKEIKDA